jgi:alkylhydroperoxidase/carboxymuconolactone decarboxylase family protein YurZ
VAEAYRRLGEAVRAEGPLSEREVHLVKLAISLAARLEGAAHAHARKAQAAGVDAESLRQVALLTCPTLGFPPMMAALGWVEDVIEKERAV